MKEKGDGKDALQDWMRPRAGSDEEEFDEIEKEQKQTYRESQTGLEDMDEGLEKIPNYKDMKIDEHIIAKEITKER